MSPTSPQPAPRGAARARRWLLRAALVAVGAFAASELALRWLLFSTSLESTRVAERVRNAASFADSQYEELYWELRDHFLRAKGEPKHAEWHAELGWTSGLFDPQTYAHRDDDPTSNKRPVLLFGDSYAQGVTGLEDSFQTLFALSEAGRTHQLLNYGVGGYGADQVALLVERALERFEGRDPLVLIGLLVDDDFDRCVLTTREQPKPRFVLRDGQLELLGEVPKYEERFGDGPPFTPSYLWRAFTRGARWLPRRVRHALSGFPALDREKEELGRAVVARMIAAVRARGLEPVFIAFHNLPSIEHVELLGWRRDVLHAPVASAGARLIDLRAGMLEFSARSGEALEGWYDHVPTRGGHYNARGNRVALELIAAQLWPAHSASAPLSVRDWSERVLRGPQASAEFEAWPSAAFAAPELRPRLSLLVGAEGPTEVRYELGPGVAGFEATAVLASQPDAARASVELTLLRDGEVVFASTLRADAPRARIEVDLRGAESLTVRASDAGDGLAGDWIALVQPRFR